MAQAHVSVQYVNFEISFPPNYFLTVKLPFQKMKCQVPNNNRKKLLVVVASTTNYHHA